MRKWMKDNKKKIPGMLEALSKLVKGEKIKLEYTEYARPRAGTVFPRPAAAILIAPLDLCCACNRYELSTEFQEAMEHHMEISRNTKIILKITDIGENYA